jgi:hypothetical protein
MHTPFLANRLSRWLAVVLAVLLSTSAALAQSTANYAFTTSSTGSLVDLSTGTTDALATGTYRDDVASAVQNIGFTFVFMGTPYTQFSVNSNGQLRLGGTAVSGTNATPTSGAAILGAFGGDNALQATGRVAYKVLPGTNRTLVVEWTGLRIPYAGDPAAGTPTQVQVLLEENTGKIEYRYGAAYNNSTGVTRAIFISSGTSAGQIGVVKTFNTTPTYDATVTSATTSSLTDNAPIGVLNSATDGSRTVFTFTPTVVPAAPTVAFTAVTQTSLTVNITDNSTNEYTFSVLRSTDNITFTSVGTVATSSTTGTGSTVTLAQTGLSANTQYYYKVAANAEGVQSFAATATATTAVAVPICGTKAVGPGAGADYPTLTAAFSAVFNNGLCGPLVLELQAAYVSSAETFPLTYNYAGATATNTVTVRPAAGAVNLSIVGTTAAAVMNIAGGKYLIIDGRPGGSGAAVSGATLATDLTISSTSTASGSVPLQFTADATFNTVQHVQIKGVGTSDSGSPDINFTGTATTGNSDNTVQYCNIGDGATTPVTLIYGGNALNARNSILNNNLFNNYGTGSTYGVYLNQSGPNWTISGNSFYQTASRASVSGTMYGIFLNANNGHTVSGNFVGGSAPSLGGTPLTTTGSAAYRFAGIYLATTTGTACSVQGNAVGNITWASSSTTSTGYGILSGIYVASGDVNVGTTAGNTIGGAAAPISVSSSSSGGYAFGISSASSGAIAVNGNTISNITGVGAAAVAVNVAGILSSTGSPTISRNKIYNLAGGSAAGGTVATQATGIWLTGGTTATVVNNLMGDLRAATSTSLVGVTGLLVGGGTTVNAYYNTIYLNATSTGATFGTSGIYLNSTSTTLDARNNIVVNKSTAVGTGGYTAALRRLSGAAGTAPSNLATTTNNNLYYAGTPSATNLIYVEGTTTATNASQTLAAYKALVSPRESSSVTEDVPFASTTGTAANFLHISTGTPTQVESGGTPIAGITTDFDGDTRSTTAPDLGADEGAFTPQDLSGPAITYTALANTASTANRTLTVTITDPSGIATGANAPRLYYRKGTTGAYVFVNGTATGSAYTFTFDYSLIGGVTGFDVVQYYVAAQDVPGNASTSPVGGSGATPPGTAAPATPNQFQILGVLSGTYYVGTGTSPNPARTYPTLTAAAASYNLNALGGAVTFLLLDATYSTAETFPITINGNADASATNTLTIRPNTGVSSAVTGSNGTALLTLNGADYVTIDGTNGGTLSGIDPRPSRNLTLTNTNTSSSSYVVLVTGASATDNATNNTVKNLVAVGSGAANTLAGIASQTATGATAANTNNVFQNNAVQAAQDGIYSYGASATLKNTGTVITQNDLNATGAAALGRVGITVGFEDGIQITRNAIDGINYNGSADVAGISVGLGLAFSTTTFTGSEVTNATISRNNIGVVRQTNTYSALGIALASAASGTSTIANNFVSGVASNGTGGDFGAGIFVGGGTGSTTRVVFNSVNMTNPSPALTGGSYPSFALAIGGTAPTVEIRNNILVNVQSTGNNSVALGFAYSSTAGAYVGLTSSNNDFFVGSGSTFSVGQTGSLGTGGTLRTTLAALNTETGQDAPATSKNVDPQFVSATDLHTSSAALNNAGVPVSGVTVDIDGDTRNASTPDIGADEYTPSPVDIAATALLAPGTIGCYGAAETVTVTITNNATAALNLALNPVTVTVLVTPPTGPAVPFTITLNTGTLAVGATQNVTLPGTLNMTTAGTYSFAITASAVGDGNASNNSIVATRTVTAGLPLPYAENFDASTNLPTGYVVDINNATYDFKVLASHGTNGSNALSADVYSSNPSSFAILPKLGNTVSANNQLTFDARFVNFASYPATGTALTGGDTLKVLVSTDCGLTFRPVFAINASNYNGNGQASLNFYTYTVPLTGVGAGQAVQLQFVALRGAGDYYVDIDNISVRSLSPIDLAPVALASPTATQGCYGPAEIVTVQVTNQGTAALNFATNAATVTAVVTTPGGPRTLTGTVSTGTLAPGASQTVTLAPTLDMSAAGTYSFAITATVQGDQNTANDVLAAVTRTVAAPVAGTVSPAASSICVSGTATLNLAGFANGIIQWQQSTNNTTFADVTGANAATFTTPVLTQTTYYRAQVRCGTQVATTNVATVTVTNPLVASTNTPQTICAGTSATLTATASAGSAVRFFDVATGGTALTSTSTGSYTTPALSANTTYYAEAYASSIENVGKTTSTQTDGGFSGGGVGIVLTAAGPTTILTATVYNATATAGSVSVELRNNATGALVGTAGPFAVVAGSATALIPTVLPLNLAVPAAGTYRLVTASTPTPPTLYRDFTTGNTYPFTSPSGQVSVTGGYNGGAIATYYFFYNLSVGGECIGATRTAIQVNVNPRPATPTITAVYNGTTTTFTSSAATGNQFYLNNVLIPGATGQTYVITGLPAPTASYTVTTTNATGCVSLPSNAAVITSAKTSIAGAGLKLYPNPTPNGEVTLELTGFRSATELTVLDPLGRVILTELLPANAGTATHALDLKARATGVYLLRLRNNDGVETRRLVRE